MIIMLPFSSDAQQQFTIQLGADKFTFFVYWSDRAGIWQTDITDATTSTVLIQGLPLVLGQRLLAPYDFGIGEILMVDTTGQGTDAGGPTTGDLGTRVTANWFSPDVVV